MPTNWWYIVCHNNIVILKPQHVLLTQAVALQLSSYHKSYLPNGNKAKLIYNTTGPLHCCAMSWKSTGAVLISPALGRGIRRWICHRFCDDAWPVRRQTPTRFPSRLTLLLIAPTHRGMARLSSWLYASERSPISAVMRWLYNYNSTWIRLSFDRCSTAYHMSQGQTWSQWRHTSVVAADRWPLRPKNK